MTNADGSTTHYMHPAPNAVFDINGVADPFLALSTQSLPWWFDANGEKHVDYAMGLNNGQFKECPCTACVELKEKQQSFNISNDRRMQIRKEAQEAVVRMGFTSKSRYGGTLDPDQVAYLLAQFAMDQLVKHEMQSQKVIQTIQLSHTAHLHRVMEQQNKMAAIRARRHKEATEAQLEEGRLFRLEEEVDGAG